MDRTVFDSMSRSIESGRVPGLEQSRQLRQQERVIQEEGIGSSAGGATFMELLQNSVQKVNEFQVQADHSVKELVAGRTKNVHGTMLSLERADMALKLMMQVRNKVMDAYREIMRMQV